MNLLLPTYKSDFPSGYVNGIFMHPLEKQPTWVSQLAKHTSEILFWNQGTLSVFHLDER